MADDEFNRRKNLTFAQAEGVEPLPSQLNRTAMPKVLRARLWSLFYSEMKATIRYTHYAGSYVGEPWATILSNYWVLREGHRIDAFPEIFENCVHHFSQYFDKDKYVAVYELVQFIISHQKAPAKFWQRVQLILEEERAAYRVFDGSILVPISSDIEASILARAMDDTRGDLIGPHAHLRAAALALSAGRYADAVRESIHAVEGAARLLEPSNNLGKALTKLKTSIGLHPQMKDGFLALYNWSSDEKGLRHALLDNGDANVDEVDAMYMVGACAAFVSYLINRSNLIAAK